MLTNLSVIAAYAIAVLAIFGSYTQASALNLQQERQVFYWPRRGTVLSGRYRGSDWVPLPSRSTYQGFSGGGPGAGK